MERLGRLGGYPKTQQPLQTPSAYGRVAEVFWLSFHSPFPRADRRGFGSVMMEGDLIF